MSYLLLITIYRQILTFLKNRDIMLGTVGFSSGFPFGTFLRGDWKGSGLFRKATRRVVALLQ